jgi:hypothetical protein
LAPWSLRAKRSNPENEHKNWIASPHRFSQSRSH